LTLESTLRSCAALKCLPRLERVHRHAAAKPLPTVVERQRGAHGEQAHGRDGCQEANVCGEDDALMRAVKGREIRPGDRVCSPVAPAPARQVAAPDEMFAGDERKARADSQSYPGRLGTERLRGQLL
jgi:hypothetical protein